MGDTLNILNNQDTQQDFIGAINQDTGSGIRRIKKIAI